MSDLHIYFETGAIGDTGLNLCRANIAMEAMNCTKTIVHTSPVFRCHNKEKKTCPFVAEIINSCNFIKSIEYDIDYNNQESFHFSKKHNSPIYQPMFFRSNNDIKNWVDLKKYIPETPISEKVAVIQPISLDMKPPEFVDCYIPVWDRCVNLLHEKGYSIYMVGGKNDKFDITMKQKTIDKTINKVGEWSILQSLAFTIYKSELVLACDSWSAIWGPAAKVKTFTAWGYRMENNIDFWVTGFLGNKEFYEYGWSSQKEYCDAYLAGQLSDYISKRKCHGKV
jgi:hypothetical protein